jgi:hypothetical protein
MKLRIRALMMEARTTETSVTIQLRTRQYIPEDSELQMKLDTHNVAVSQLAYYY